MARFYRYKLSQKKTKSTKPFLTHKLFHRHNFLLCVDIYNIAKKKYIYQYKVHS